MPVKPKVLVGVTGSVATIKLSLLVQQLLEFAEVQVVTTDAAQTFFKQEEIPDGVKVWTNKEEWDSWHSRSDPVTHIELRRWADIFVIAPLSANSLAKLAYGLSDNLLTCVARAWDYKKPFLVAPAMNTFMWDQPHTAKHLKKIRKLGIHVIDPIAKKLACGDIGNGAMAEVAAIVAAVDSHIHTLPSMVGTLKEVIEKGKKESGKEGGGKVAVAAPDEGVELTYSELVAEITDLTKKLVDSGVQKGEVIAVILPNGLPFLVSFLAVTWSRAIAAPLNSAYTADEFAFYLEDIKAKVVILAPGAHPGRDAAQKLNIPIWELKQHAEDKKKLTLEVPNALSAAGSHGDPTPDDVALFLHTSGTTSRPKLVPLTHKNLSISISNIAGSYKLTAADTSLIVMPLFHVHGLLGATLSSLSTGGTVVVPAKFSASAFWNLVHKYNATWYSAVPTIHQILLVREKEIPEKHPLRFVRSCSSSLAPSVLQNMESKFGVPVLEAYGMTEAAHQMASNPLPEDGPHKPGSVGKGTNVDIAILDEKGGLKKQGELGEVCIRGANVTLGYYNNPNANKDNFTSDGWFRTGDQGYLDLENFLFLTGRIKELINRGGEKISPVEVDAALLEHPKVSEAICFAVPDEKYGEEIHAAVVPKEGNSVTEKEIEDFAKSRLSAFKVPKKIYIADKLPRTATGKLQRRHIAEFYINKAKEGKSEK